MKKLILIPFFLIFASADNSIVLLNEAISVKRDNDNSLADCYITCWGDSLISMGGWTYHLENLSNMTGLTPNADDLDDINIGKVPQQLLIDSVHFTESTRIVIGNLIYNACKDLNIF